MSENLSIAEDINTKAEQLRELAKTGDEKVLAAIAFYLFHVGLAGFSTKVDLV